MVDLTSFEIAFIRSQLLRVAFTDTDLKLVHKLDAMYLDKLKQERIESCLKVLLADVI